MERQDGDGKEKDGRGRKREGRVGEGKGIPSEYKSRLRLWLNG